MSGLDFLHRHSFALPPTPDAPCPLPEELGDIYNRVLASAAVVPVATLFSSIMSRLSHWPRMVNTIRCTLAELRSWMARARLCWPASVPPPSNADVIPILEAQLARFSGRMSRLQDGHPLPARDKLASLDPFLDHSGALWVGGRHRLDPVSSFNVRHPLLPDSAA